MWDKIFEHFSTLEHRTLERMSLLVAVFFDFWIIRSYSIASVLQKKKAVTPVNLGFTLIHLVIHTFLAIFIVILPDCCFLNNLMVYWLHAGV
jgi:hypothetical protein